jgi:sulfide:quinone oxidoreductase
LAAFGERGIHWHPGALIVSLDPSRHVAVTADEEFGYDLFLGVPRHHAPKVVQESGMCVDGWIPVDAHTLETRFPGVYAVGDVTSVGTPKAGVFAEGQARVVASSIIASLSPQHVSTEYDGRGVCYLEFGGDRVARVEVTFTQGAAPSGFFEEPSQALAEQKDEFGSSRVRRWFDREWSTR